MKNGPQSSEAIRKLGPHYDHLGEAPPRPGVPTSWNHEGSGFMRFVNRLRGMNAMAYFHDMWAADWKMGQFSLRASIPVAIVGTYAALGAGREASLLKTSAEAREKHAYAIQPSEFAAALRYAKKPS